MPKIALNECVKIPKIALDGSFASQKHLYPEYFIGKQHQI